MTNKSWEDRWSSPGYIYIAVSVGTIKDPKMTVKIGVSKDPEARFNYKGYAGIDDWGIMWKLYDRLPTPIENTLCFKELKHLRKSDVSERELFEMTEQEVVVIPAIIESMIIKRDAREAWMLELTTNKRHFNDHVVKWLRTLFRNHT